MIIVKSIVGADEVAVRVLFMKGPGDQISVQNVAFTFNLLDLTLRQQGYNYDPIPALSASRRNVLASSSGKM